MKNLVITILVFFACLSGLAQDMEKRFFENNPEMGGDVVIKSSSVKIEKNEISKTFEIESPEEGAYYLDAWIMAPFTKEGYPEYKVAVNGILSEFTFKPQINDWQSLALTDAKKSAAAVRLKKGVNSIAVIGKGPEIPNVEFIKLSSNLNRAGISDSNYRKFVESIKSGTLNEVYNIGSEQVSSSRGTNGQIYDYYVNMPVYYSTYQYFKFAPGNINILLGAVSAPAVIELFSVTNPESYSWSTTVTSVSSPPVNWIVQIPVIGIYLILLRPLNPNSSGVATLGVDGSTTNVIFTGSSQLTITGGYPTLANFFTCKIKNGGDTWLWLIDNSEKVRAFNDNGGTTSDGYSWGSASRIKTELTTIRSAHVSSYSSNNPVFECDLYGGLAKSDSIFAIELNSNGTVFPNLDVENSFVSAPEPEANNYFCYHWSVGIDSIGPNDNFRIYPQTLSVDSIELWNAFYDNFGYTHEGANADNAAIVLWTRYNVDTKKNNINHASVRKNSTKPKPHGFEWESKMGDLERIMHTRDALAGSAYGSITHYYRPKSGTVNYSPPVFATVESSFSASDLNRAAVLKSQIPAAMRSGFEEKYLAWEKSWSRPEIAIHSNPYRYAESTEYEDLMEYGLKYGKAIWPLLFEKLTPKNIFIVNLLKDLTYGGKWSFGNDIMPVLEKGKPWPSAYSVLVDYCKKLLAREEGNIQKSIREISTEEEGNFEVNISVSGQNILLNLYSIEDEKASVAVYNVSGGLELEAGYKLLKGSQTLVINASNFKKGIYVVQIIIGGESISQTISI